MEIIPNKIREIVPKIKDYKKKNVLEAGTKRGLIEPLFEKIGWDFSDIEAVEPEFPVVFDGVNEPVDYALRIDKKLSLFVEAKRVNAEIKDAIRDGTKKALEKSVHWLIATNGDIIAVLKIDEKIPEPERTIFKIVLSEEVNDEQALAEAANLLLLLNPENVKSGNLEIFALKELKRKRITNVIKSVLVSKDFEKLFEEKYKNQYPGDKPDTNILKQIVGMINLGTKKKTPSLTHKPAITDPELIKKKLDRIFKYPSTQDKKSIKKNIMEKKELWLKFIDVKKMSTQEFKDHYDFLPKATGGFCYYLQINGLATKVGYDKIRKGAIFKINENIIPEIKELLGVT
jgi:predicted type IV restriction endonuclease